MHCTTSVQTVRPNRALTSLETPRSEKHVSFIFTKPIELETIGNRIDMQTQPATAAGSTTAYWYAQYGTWFLATVRSDGFRNPVNWTFDLLTYGSMHAERLLQSIRVPSLVLINQAVFMLERGQTHRQTRLNALPTPAAMPAWVLRSLRTSLNSRK